MELALIVNIKMKIYTERQTDTHTHIPHTYESMCMLCIWLSRYYLRFAFSQQNMTQYSYAWRKMKNTIEECPNVMK